MSEKVWRLPQVVYPGDCVGMKREDYDALAARLAEAEGREQMLLRRCDELEDDRNASDAQLAEAERERDEAQRALSEHSRALLAKAARLAEAEADAQRYRWIAAAPRDRASLEWIENKAELDAYIDVFFSPGNTDDRS